MNYYVKIQILLVGTINVIINNRVRISEMLERNHGYEQKQHSHNVNVHGILNK